MARLRILVVAQETDGDVYPLAVCKFYAPGTATASGSSTSGTPFAGNLYAAISGGSPISTTQALNSSGTLTVWTDTASRLDVGIEPAGGGTAFVRQYEAAELDPAEVLATSTDGVAGGAVAVHGTSGGVRVYDRATPYSAYHEIYNTGGTFGLYSSALAADALTVSAAGLLNLTQSGTVLASLPTALASIGLGLYREAEYARVGLSHLLGGTRVASSGDYANSSGYHTPVATHTPTLNLLTYTTPDAATSTAVAAANTISVERTGASVTGLTMVSATATTITVSGITATLDQYVGWTVLITTGGEAGTQLKVTGNAATSGGNTVFTGSGGWSASTPTGTPTAVLNYGSLSDLDGLAVVVRDDSSSRNTTSGIHSTIAVHGYATATATSRGHVIGVFGQVANFGSTSFAEAGELNVSNYSGVTAPFYTAAAPVTVGLGIGGGPGTHIQFTATGTGASTVSLSTASWTTNEHVGKSVYVKSGTGVGQHRVVQSNTATQLTVSVAWTTQPSGAVIVLGSAYASVALAIGTLGTNGGFRQGLWFDSGAFSPASSGSIGIGFHPSAGCDFPVLLPNATYLYAWTAAADYATSHSGLSAPASQPFFPLIGSNAGGQTLVLNGNSVLIADTAAAASTPGYFDTVNNRLGVGVAPSAQLHVRGAGQAVAAYDPTTGNMGGALFVVDSGGNASNGGFVGLGANAASGPDVQAGFKFSLTDATTYGLGYVSFVSRAAAGTAALAEQFRIAGDGVLDFRNSQVGFGTSALTAMQVKTGASGPSSANCDTFLNVKIAGTTYKVPCLPS